MLSLSGDASCMISFVVYRRVAAEPLNPVSGVDEVGSPAAAPLGSAPDVLSANANGTVEFHEWP